MVIATWREERLKKQSAQICCRYFAGIINESTPVLTVFIIESHVKVSLPMLCRTMEWLFMLAEVFVEILDSPASRSSSTTNDY